LHHVPEEKRHDASTPVINPDVHIRQPPQLRLFEEIRNPHGLNHVKTEDQHDMSSPFLEFAPSTWSDEGTSSEMRSSTWKPEEDEAEEVDPNVVDAKKIVLGEAMTAVNFKDVNKEIVEHPAELRHVSTGERHDASAPIIAEDAHLPMREDAEKYEEKEKEPAPVRKGSTGLKAAIKGIERDVRKAFEGLSSEIKKSWEGKKSKTEDEKGEEKEHVARKDSKGKTPRDETHGKEEEKEKRKPEMEKPAVDKGDTSAPTYWAEEKTH
jgi:hypothetical protein